MTEKYTYKEGAYKSKHRIGAVSWADMQPQMVRDFIAVMTANGYGVTFSQTLDGSSLSVTILMGKDRIREYPKDMVELAQAFDSILSWADLVLPT